MQTFHFDLSAKSDAPVLYVKQGDVGRRFRAVVTDGGAAYAIPAGAQFSVWFSGPGGEGNYKSIGDRSAFAVEGNTVTVELIAQMLVNAGTGAMCLALSADDGTQLGLWNMVYAVEHVPGMGSKAVEDCYTALSELLRQAIDAAETFEVDASLSAPGKAADAAAVGEALAGCGLGGGAAVVNSPNDAGETGFYAVQNDAEMPADHWWAGSTRKYEDGYAVQRFTRLVSGERIQRIKWDHVWRPWEWENPPLYPGVEYRTAERWKGKVVYVKMVDFGALPNASTKTVTCGIKGEFVVDARAIVLTASKSFKDFPYIHTDATAAGRFYVDANGRIAVTTTTNLSDISATFVVKYTKSESTSTLKITKQPQSVEAALNDAVSFSVEAEGEGLSYQWRYSSDGGTTWNNTDGTGNKTATLRIGASNTYNGWQYSCVITDANGNQAVSEPATLTVKEG